MNEIRIIAGQFRGRRIHFHPSRSLRPTLDAVRETLFNWLMFKIKDANCLDAFAGSGALGFEALSRFAKQVAFVEHDKEAVIHLKKSIKLLGLEAHACARHDSTLHFLAKESVKPFELIFLDPPFEADLLEKSLKLIHERNWLQKGGLIYFEAERKLDIHLVIGRNYSLYRHKSLGEVQFGLLESLK